MVDALTPDGVRARRFDVSRRGYERTQVEEFLSDVADRLAEMEDAVARFEAGGLEIGIDDQEALARELHTIGSDVTEILEAARTAAEGIRSRAEADAAAWTAEARSEHDRLTTDADQQSQAARSSAWKEGTALLASATAEASALMEAASEETLFVRAEAEREALRLTGDARRDRDEILRAARAEAEVTLERSRVDSDAVLRAANQQAEQAQERARALEDRRSELLAELEAARASITEMEEEIESKRQELEAPPEDPGADDQRSHHGDDGGSVRIVSSASVVPLRPVDAEELVAEVTALRSGASEPEPPSDSGSTADDPGDGAESTPAAVVPLVDSADEPSDDSGLDDVEVGEPELDEPEPGGPRLDRASAVASPASVDDSGEVGAAAGAVEKVTEPPVPEDRAVSERVDDETPGPADEAPSVGGGLDSLFAALRSASDDAGPGIPESEDPDVPERSVPPGPLSPDADVAGESERSSEPVDAGAAAEDSAAEGPAAESDPDTESASLPHRNTALRSIKRSLVELQNETLEHLRTDAGWLPSEDFTDRFRDDFGTLAEALTGVRDDAAGGAFGADLYDAVTSTIERSRSAGSGEREIAAAASKIFRMWRSDEAERRVFDAFTVDA